MATDSDLPTTHHRPRTVWLIAGIVLALLGLGVAAPAVSGWEAGPDLHEAVASAEAVAPSATRARRRKLARWLRQPAARPAQQPARMARTQRVPRQLSLLPPLRRGPPALLA